VSLPATQLTDSVKELAMFDVIAIILKSGKFLEIPENTKFGLPISTTLHNVCLCR
jgi:hypothetical protein